MAHPRTPILLYAWLMLTWGFACLLVALSWMLHRRMGADPKRFSERLGKTKGHNTDPVIWFHAASLGEIRQIAQLAQKLTRVDDLKILVTTTTATGARWVAQELPYVTHRFGPLDTPAAVRCFLDSWSISVAIFVEGELWPRQLLELERRGVPRILLNARHSRTRTRFPVVFERLLGGFAVITCRSERVARELRALGLSAEQIHVLPDLRLTLPKLDAPHRAVTSLIKTIGSRPVWLAASTHPADENEVVSAHQEVCDALPDALLIIAPRHPDRGQALYTLARKRALSAKRRSLNEDLSSTTQIYIADTLGELGIFYAVSPISFMGGSFGEEGGHDPYEPAHFNAAIVHGPNVKNFAHVYDALKEADAAVQVNPSQLGHVIVDLLRNSRTKTSGQVAQTFMKQAQNATANYVDLIVTTLHGKRGLR